MRLTSWPSRERPGLQGIILLNPQVVELSENLKLRLENPTGENQHDRSLRTANPAIGNDAESTDEAESQMRKALGLLGEGQRHRSEPERPEQPHRVSERFNGG